MVLSYWFYFLWQWSDLNFKFSACSGHYQMCWVAQHPIFQCLGHYYIEVFLRNVTPNATQLVSQPSLQFCCCLVAKLCPSLLQPTLLCPWDFPGKDTKLCCHFLLQGIFLTQVSNLHLLHWQVDSLPLSHQERPWFYWEWDWDPLWELILFVLFLVANSCLTFWTPWTVAHQASLSMGFPRHEYWSGFPFPSLEDLPDPGIKPVSSALAGGFFTTEPHIPGIWPRFDQSGAPTLTLIQSLWQKEAGAVDNSRNILSAEVVSGIWSLAVM